MLDRNLLKDFWVPIVALLLAIIAFVLADSKKYAKIRIIIGGVFFILTLWIIVLVLRLPNDTGETTTPDRNSDASQELTETSTDFDSDITAPNSTPIPQTETNLISTSQPKSTEDPNLTITQAVEATSEFISPLEVAWIGEYFANKNFGQPVAFERMDESLDFNWGTGNPAPNVPADNFSVRWTKCHSFEEGTYRFIVQVDDYVTVYVDDIEVISANYHQDTIEQSFQVASGNHCIQVDMIEAGHDAFVYFDYFLEEVSSISSNDAWTGQYFANNNFERPVAFERKDESINFDWGTGNPAPNIPIDYFSVRWSKCLDFEEGTYNFFVRADDYVTVYVDDIKVVSANYHQDTIEQPFQISSGNHCIQVDMIEAGFDAFVYFDYELSSP